MRLASASLVLALLLGCARPPSVPARSSEPTRRSLVVISIDGLRYDYFDDRTHALPNLRRLREEGAHARRVRSVWPTVTYAAHTTLVTGVRPAKHGILSNVLFDPFETNDYGWYWYAADIRVPALWDAAGQAGIDVANATWPVTVGAPIRWNLPQFWRAKSVEDEKLLAAISTPGLYAEVARFGPPPGEHRGDRARADAAKHLIATRHPGLTLVYLADLDTAQHDHGPLSAGAWATLEATDRLVGEIVATASAALPRFALAIVSDHGFVPVDTDVRPNVALRAEGLLVATTRAKDGRTEDVLQSWDALTWKAGGSAAIYGRRGREEPTASKVRALFTRLAADPANRIASVLDGEAVEREGGYPGAIVVLQAAAGASFSERYDGPLTVPGHYKGSHGHSPDLAEMGTSFFVWGDGVQRADLGDVDMIDIAPTLAELLGLALPTADGKPLAAAVPATRAD